MAMSSSSTSKTRTEQAGITDPTPSSPYARLGRLGGGVEAAEKAGHEGEAKEREGEREVEGDSGAKVQASCI